MHEQIKLAMFLTSTGSSNKPNNEFSTNVTVVIIISGYLLYITSNS